MNTITRMKRLDRLRLGQVQASSDPEIVRDLKRAHLELTDVTVLGEPLDYAHMINAWLWGLARLPVAARKEVTQVLVRDLERWRLEQVVATPAMLLEGLRTALCESLVEPDQGEQVADAVQKVGVVERPRRNHDARRQKAPRPRGTKG